MPRRTLSSHFNQRDGATQRESIVRYIINSARPVDRNLFELQEGSGDGSRLFEALADFQNGDGGFGHALEPDLRTPESSALATSVAFQYLVAAGAPSSEPLVSSGIRCFVNSLGDSRDHWQSIPPSTDDHPAAPWWDYQRSLQSTEWGNPSAEILGYFLKYAELVDDESLLARLTERAFLRLSGIDEPEFHELLDYQRLYEQADAEIKTRLLPRLSEFMVTVVEDDPLKWKGYLATPLTFVDSPESSFASLFDQTLLEADLERLLSSIVDGDHWEPTWTWDGNYPAEWKTAKREWSGMLTVRNQRILQNFGVL